MFFCDTLDIDQKEYIKKLINVFCDTDIDIHVIHHLYQFFYGKSNEYGFRYLQDMLATIVEVEDGEQKKVINILFCHVKHHLYLFFKGNRMR